MRPPGLGSHDANPLFYVSLVICFLHALEAIVLTGATKSLSGGKLVSPFFAMVSVMILPLPMFKWLAPSRPYLKVMRVAEMFIMFAMAHAVHGSSMVVLDRLLERPLFCGIMLVAVPVNLIDAMCLSPLAFLRASLFCLGFISIFSIIYILPVSLSFVLFLIALCVCCCALRGFCISISNHAVAICSIVQILLFVMKYFGINRMQDLWPMLLACALEAAVQVQLVVDFSFGTHEENATRLVESGGRDNGSHAGKSGRAASAVFACVKDNKLKFFERLCTYTEMPSGRHPQTGQLAFLWAHEKGVDLKVFKERAEKIVHECSNNEEVKGAAHLSRLCQQYLQAGGFILLKAETVLLWMSISEGEMLKMLFTHTDDATWKQWADDKLQNKQVHGDGLTALHIAVNQGSMDLLRKMLKLGAEPSMEVRYEGSKVVPLWMAIQDLSLNRLEIVMALLDAKANPEAVRPQSDDLTMLLAAIQQEVDVTAVRKEHDGEQLDVGNIDAKADESQPLLQKTASAREIEQEIEQNRILVVQALVAANADVNVSDKTGLTALHLSVRKSVGLVKILLQGRADPERQAGELWQTPLLLALGTHSQQGKSQEIASQLLQAKADASRALLESLQLYDHDGAAGLDSNRRFKEPEVCAKVVRILVELKAAVNVRHDADRCTALHYAARHHSVVVVRQLLTLKADAEPHKGENEESPLWLAVNELWKESPLIAKALLQAGADANSEGKQGRQLLITAAKQISFLVGTKGKEGSEGEAEAVCDNSVRALLDARAKVNVKEPVTQYTALHYAGQYSLKLVKTLLERRADADTEAAELNGARPTPLSLTITPQGKSTLASQADRPLIAEALLRAGANPNGDAVQFDTEGQQQGNFLQLAVSRTSPFQPDGDAQVNAESKAGAGIIAALLDHGAKMKNFKQEDKQRAVDLLEGIGRKDLCSQVTVAKRGLW